MQPAMPRRLFGERTSQLLNSRRGTIVLGAVAALLAGLLLVVYLVQYRNSVNLANQPTPVLVAKRMIPKGTSISVAGTQNLLGLETIPQRHVRAGAVADSVALRGRVAIADIYPGQQLTIGDFTATTTEAIPTRITGSQRAVSVALDPARGLVGQVAAGDRVDVYVSLDGEAIGNVVKLILPNVLVLGAPGGPSGGLGANNAAATYVLRVKGADVARLAYATDNGTLWFAVRPSAKAKPASARVVTGQSMLFGHR